MRNLIFNLLVILCCQVRNSAMSIDDRVSRPIAKPCPWCCYARVGSWGWFTGLLPGAAFGVILKHFRPNARLVRPFDKVIAACTIGIFTGLGTSLAFVSYAHLGHTFVSRNGALHKWKPALNDATAGAIAGAFPGFFLPMVTTLALHEKVLHAFLRGLRGGIIGGAIGGGIGAYTTTKVYWHVISRHALGFMCIPPVDISTD